MPSLYRLPTTHWHVLRIVFLVAGVLIVSATGAALWYESLLPLAVLLFVGSMQIIFALTGFCPLAILLTYLHIPQK